LAVSAYTAAIRLDPQDSTIYEARSYAYAKLGLDEEAGTASSYSPIARQWRRLVREAGFKDTKKDGGITFHSLRHTWATHALHAGVPIHVVKDRLGHQDIRTTLDIYGHVLTGGEESAAAVFEEIFSA